VDGPEEPETLDGPDGPDGPDTTQEGVLVVVSHVVLQVVLVQLQLFD